MKSHFNILCLSFCCFILSVNVHAQDDWFASFGGAQYQRSTMIAKDSQNNIYVCGSFRGEFDADPGENVQIQTAGTYEDIFLAKYSQEGELIWSFDIGGDSQDFADKLVIDSEDNIHIMGTFQGSVDFDPGPNSFTMETMGNPLLSSNMYIAKYTPDGNFIQALHFRTTENNRISGNTSLAIDSQGNLFVSGSTNGTIDMDPLQGEYLLEMENDFNDVVIAKLSPTGELIWAHKIGGSIGDSNGDITVDEEDNVYCTGLFRSTADFDPGAGTFILSPQGANTFNDIFILSLDNDGNFRWAKGIGWDGSQDGQMIRMGADGFLYCLGYYENTVNFNPNGVDDMTLTSNSSTDNFLLKLSTEGEALWARGWGADFANRVRGFSQGPNNELIVSGAFNGTIDFGNGSVLATEEGFDGYVITWSADGDLNDVFTFGGEDDELAVMALKEANGKYLLTGFFNASMQLQVNNSDSQFESLGEDDWFLAYFTPGAPVSVKGNRSLDFSVFPNPTEGFLRVEGMAGHETIHVRLLDAQGKLIRTWRNPSGLVLDLSDLKQGMYYLIIDSESGTGSQKVVIQ